MACICMKRVQPLKRYWLHGRMGGGGASVLMQFNMTTDTRGRVKYVSFHLYFLTLSISSFPFLFSSLLFFCFVAGFFRGWHPIGRGWHVPVVPLRFIWRIWFGSGYRLHVFTSDIIFYLKFFKMALRVQSNNSRYNGSIRWGGTSVYLYLLENIILEDKGIIIITNMETNLLKDTAKQDE